MLLTLAFLVTSIISREFQIDLLENYVSMCMLVPSRLLAKCLSDSITCIKEICMPHFVSLLPIPSKQKEISVEFLVKYNTLICRLRVIWTVRFVNMSSRPMIYSHCGVWRLQWSFFQTFLQLGWSHRAHKEYPLAKAMSTLNSRILSIHHLELFSFFFHL